MNGFDDPQHNPTVKGKLLVSTAWDSVIFADKEFTQDKPQGVL
jgi:hypothetical protein